MVVPISIRLDDDVRGEREAQARARGIGLSTVVRDPVTSAARDARHARIREASERVAGHLASSSGAQSFYEGWAPRAPIPADGPLIVQAGQIVLADWRSDARPKEPNSSRSYSARITSAAFSAIMYTALTMKNPGMRGNTEASTTRNPVVP
jgi:hypothetical protein